MQVLHRNGGASGIVKPVHCLDAEQAQQCTVQDEKQDEDAHNTHQWHRGNVALAVVRGTKDWSGELAC